jgi:choline-glycine betaine transporter
MEGGVAAVLLFGGGLQALQTATTITGLPFSLLILFMCFSFYKSLTEYWLENRADYLPYYADKPTEEEEEKIQR